MESILPNFKNMYYVCQMVTRKAEKQVLKLIKIFPVIGIVGPRQSGKTTLLKQILSAYKKDEAIYLDLELPTTLLKLNDPESFFRENNQKLILSLPLVQKK